MTDGVVCFLQRSGMNVETRDKDNPKLTDFRRNIFFPELLFELGLTGHREERFILKIETQDQGVCYPVETRYVQRCGFFFSLPTPPDSVLLAITDLNVKKRDFEHLLFNSHEGEKILRFPEFIAQMSEV